MSKSSTARVARPGPTGRQDDDFGRQPSLSGLEQNSNQNSLQAAVLIKSDPRAGRVARVVPDDATLCTVGTAVLGYWHRPSPTSPLPLKRQSAPVYRIRAFARWNELARLVDYRCQNGLALGPPIGWAMLATNTLAAAGYSVDVVSVNWFCRCIRLPMIDPDIVAAIARDSDTARRVAGVYAVMPAAGAGALIELTSVERDELRITTMDGWDEPAEHRKRRLARERKQRQRQRHRP